MPNRRQVLLGLGTAVASSVAAIGTGAFTNTETSRSVNVAVANEDAAYLGLEPGDDAANGVFANQNQDNQIAIDINDEISGYDNTGTGVGLDSIYEFDDVFRVTNQGTQNIFVQIDPVSLDDNGDGTDDLVVEFYVRDADGNRVTIDGDGGEVELTTGAQAQIGLLIDTTSNIDIPGDDTTRNFDTVIQAEDSATGAGTTVTDP